MNSQQLSTLALVIAGLIDLAIRVAAIIVIPRNRKPSAATAWLMAIFVVPYAGLIFFLLLGSSRLPRARRDKQAEINRLIAAGAQSLPPVSDRARWPAWFASVVALNTSLGAVPLVGGNTARLLGDYEGSIAAMAADIDTAETFVHVQFYIISCDPTTQVFFTAMEDAVKRGVTVRVLLDHISSLRTAGHKATFAELDRIGVSWHFLLPVQPLQGKYQRPDLRNHRKLVVIDGRVGYIGSQNLIDRSYNSPRNLSRGLQWQELVTRVTGPVVSGINVVFLSDWYSETDEMLSSERVPVQQVSVDTSPQALDMQVIPSGPGFEGENNLRLFLALLYSAQERIIITSPYFVPDESMMYAITSARQRGLDVQLFVSELGDQGAVFHAQRSYYSALLTVGVRIWLYPAPYILHAKHFSIDDDVAVIGSSNMDIRSFSLNYEACLMVRGASFVADMRRVEDGYRAVSRELTLEEITALPLRSTVLDGLARLTSGLQ